jgi:uncharacterized glyoxalase superfamily protein PhnB
MRGAVLLMLLLALGCRDRQQESPWVAAARACAAGSELSCVRPIFNVHSLRDAERYYRDALGFKVDWEHGQPADFASVSRGDAVIFMCQGCQGNPGTWVMVFSRDVDALHDELRQKGALVRMPPTNMPWGMREMHVSDTDGNVLRFGTGIDE